MCKPTPWRKLCKPGTFNDEYSRGRWEGCYENIYRWEGLFKKYNN
jgi:hypothetical protein